MTRKTWWPMPAQVAWLLPLSLLLIATAACGSTDEPSGLTPAERLEAAAARMEQVTSLDFTLSHEEGHTSLMPGFILEGADGAVRESGQATVRAETRVPGANTFFELEIRIDGGMTSLTDPFSGVPLSLSSDSLPINVTTLGSSLGRILRSINDPAFTTSETIEGAASRGIAGTATGEDLRSLLPNAVGPWQQEITVWVDDNDLVRRARIIGRVIASDPDPVVRILTFRNFGQSQPSAGAP